MNLVFRALLVVVSLILIPGAALAQDQAVEDARKHFDKGQTLYSVDKFDEAAAEFLKAYESKPFPAFLYNAAVAFEKAGKYEDAVKYFKRYLEKSENAPDKEEVQKRIKIIEEEIDRLEKQKNAPPPPPVDPANPDASAPPPPEPPAPSRLEVLPEVRVKGLVIVESKPSGATVYIDDKKKGAVGETPWNGTLEGEHTVIIEAKGFQTEKKKISPSGDKLLWIYVSLSRDEALGWVEVTANVPGADVYIDDKDVGAVGRTPFRGNVEKGKRKIIVSRTGYQDVVKEVKVEAGKVHKVSIKLAEAEVGFVKIRGATVYGAKVSVDGTVVCEKAPCRFEAPVGERQITVSKSGQKSLKKKLMIEKLTETQIKVDLAPQPGRADAYWQFFFAGAFAGGAYYLYYEGDKRMDDALCRDMAAPPCVPDEDDEKKAKLLKYSSYGVAGLSGLILIRGVYFLFREKGAPSTAIITTRDISWRPVYTKDVAGFEAAFDF